MSNTEQPPRMCEHCEKRPATIAKTGKHTSMVLNVCEHCSDEIDKASLAWEQVAKNSRGFRTSIGRQEGKQ